MHCVAKRYLTCGPMIDYTGTDGNVLSVTYDVSVVDGETNPKTVVLSNVETVTPREQAPKAGDWIIEQHNTVDWMPEHEFRQHYTIIGETS